METSPNPTGCWLKPKPTLGTRSHIAARCRVAERFPDFWWGGFSCADWLVHFGTLVGYDPSESRRWLERTLELNPRFLPGWDTSIWVTAAEADTVRVARAVAALDGSTPDRSSGRAGLRHHADLSADSRSVEAKRSARDGPARYCGEGGCHSESLGTRPFPKWRHAAIRLASPGDRDRSAGSRPLARTPRR